MKKKVEQYKKTIVIAFCLALFFSFSVILVKEWLFAPSSVRSKTIDTVSSQVSKKSEGVISTKEKIPAVSHSISDTISESTPKPEKPPHSVLISQKNTDNNTHFENELHVIQSFSTEMSNWKGMFGSGLKSRKVSLSNAMVNGQPLEEGTILYLELFDDVKVQAVVSKSFRDINGTISTTAKLAGSEYGRVFIASTDGQVHARIRIPEEGKIYSIEFEHEARQHYVLELDPSLAEPDEGNDQRYIPVSQSNETPEGPIATFDGPIGQGDEGTDQFAVIDVMVVYTDDALVNAGSQATMDNNIALGVSMANDAHTNTGSFIIWNLVHSYEVAYNETGSNGTDLESVTFVDEILDTVHTVRDTYGADFVVMMNATGSGGIAWVLQSPSGNSSYSFSVVDDNSFLGYTPVHEVGHNMGLSHAKDQNVQPGPTSWNPDTYGYGSTTAGWHWHPTPGADGYCSVMTYSSGTYFADGLNHVRVGIFADPNISDHGMATGDIVNGDSARVLRQLRHVYAAYRSRLSTPSILVDYPNDGEMLVAGNTYNILWDSYGVTGEVKIELLTNSSLDQVIDADTLNDRAYEWTVPAGISGTGYAIRISNLAGTITDTSNATFVIGKVFYDEPLNSNPGFTATGTWEYGVPVAVDNATYGGPGEAYTGNNIYDTNLDGTPHADSNLTTAAIDCSNYSSTKLKFIGQFSVYTDDYAKVQVSNNGTIWTDLYSVANLWSTGWSEHEYDISAVADGQSTVYIRWVYGEGTSGSFSGMSVDDIQLFGLYVSSSPSVTLSVNNASIAENGGFATVTATLSKTYTAPVTVNLAFSGTAASGVDYLASNTSITIGASFTTGTITISGINDSVDESDETVIVDISSVTNGTENGTQQVTTTLLDDDHTVTFQTDGTTGSSLTGNTVQTVTHGSNCTQVLANAPTGYQFTNWSGGVSSTTNPVTVANVTSNLTITANFAQTYTVSYNGNGNTSGSIPAAQTKINGIDLTLATNSGSLARTGYVFAGWNTLAAGTGTNYAEGGTYSTNSAVTLYAKWTALPTYTVIYNANGATSGNIPTSQTKTQGIILTLASNTGNLAKTGYSFAGWNTASNGAGTNYAEGATFSTDSPVTLYARWTVLSTYTVTYNANDATGGTVPPSQTKIHSENLTLAGNSGNLTKTGYTFAGWNTDPDGTGTDYAEGAVYTLNVQLVLFAKWELNGTSFWNLVLPAILNNSRETR